ncbi:MAG: aspartyl protease family protein [Candidatus Acidiferrales bacterium]
MANFRRIVLFLLPLVLAVCLPVIRAQNPAPDNAPAPSASVAPTLQDALRLYRTGKLDDAIQAYKQLGNGPQAALAYAGLTRVYLRKKDPQDAYAAAAKAVEIAPNLPDVEVARGEALFRQGKIPEAEARFVAVINSGAENARAYLGLARVSQAISLFHREKLMIDKARALDPADPDVTRFWMGTLTLGERIKALHDYLAQETDDDAEARTALERQLITLQSLPTVPTHQCRMVSKINSTTTDLNELFDGPTRIRGYGLTVKFNGTPAHLLLDTGAGGILIDHKLAEKAGVEHVVESSIRGIGDKGAVGSYVGHVDKIQIGDIEFQDCNIQVADQSSVIGSEGLIGAVVFSRFLVDLDMRDRKLRLSELPARPNEAAMEAALESGQERTPRFSDRYIAPEMKSYTPVFRFNHMLLIPTKLNDSVTKLFLIDTGAFNNIISPDAAREVTKVSDDPRMHVKGISGNVKNVYSGDELTLTFSNMRQKNQDIVAVDMKGLSDGAGTKISGTLGFAMLRMLDIKIDYRDDLVSFAYDWKHPY